MYCCLCSSFHSIKILSNGIFKLSIISNKTEGFSGADLKALCVEAGMTAIKNKKNVINDKDFSEALEKIKNRLLDTSQSEPENWLYY